MSIFDRLIDSVHLVIVYYDVYHYSNMLYVMNDLIWHTYAYDNKSVEVGVGVTGSGCSGARGEQGQVGLFEGRARGR